MSHAEDRRLAVCERRLLGIVLERCESRHPWQDHFWRAGALFPEGGPVGEWRLLGEGPGWRRFYAGALPLGLYSGKTVGYRENLSSRQPVVYVVLRRREGAHEIAPLLVTACPLEAQGYNDSGDDIVEAVPMPPAVEAWVRHFVDCHHVEKPFVKRERKSRRDEAGGGPGRRTGEPNEET